MKTQCEGFLSINGGTQYGAVGGSQWMLALKLEPIFCVPNPQESESTVLADVECWHPLATANGSALSARSATVFQFSPSSYRKRLCNDFAHVECEHRLATASGSVTVLPTLNAGMIRSLPQAAL